jgi:undecaprenyl-diphosphatase
MIDILNRVDTELFLFINGIHSPFWDKVMWFISGKIQWLPLYIILAGWVIYRFRWKAVLVFVLTALLITASDQLSVRLFKEVFQRLRPCRNEEIMNLVHMVNDYCGGMYGFVSNHAANTFALASFTALIFRKRTYTVFIYFWALVVSYSRIYLGVHYPGDVIGGALLGVVLALLAYWLYIYVGSREAVKRLLGENTKSQITNHK